MSERAQIYSGSLMVELRDAKVEVEYSASFGDVDEWWFRNRALNQLKLTERERESIDEAVWEDAQL